MLLHFGLGPYLNLIYFGWISLVICGLILWLNQRAEKQNKDPIIWIHLSLLILVTGFIGARLFHVLYESPYLYKNNPYLAFMVWNGGYVFLGGLLTSVGACLLYLKYKKESFLNWADFFSPVISLGYALGRVACFLVGCCYGKVCELPWGLDFGDNIFRHPTQAYAFLWEISVFVYLVYQEKRIHQKTGYLFAQWLILHGIGRILMESFREDFRGTFILDLSISTWISSVLIFTGFLVLGKIRNSASRL